jgi:lipopolysaccharide transport system permease protein
MLYCNVNEEVESNQAATESFQMQRPLESHDPSLTIRVDAQEKLAFLNWAELWHYRETLYFLIERDFKLRYRQTVLGASWAVIQPLVTMIIFTFIFGGVAKVSTDNIPYPIFSFAALVPWTFFMNGVSTASDSLVGQSHLVRKVYFPRILIPLARVLGGMIDYFVALVTLFVLMLLFGYFPQPISLIALPLLSLLMLITTLALSLWFSALNVRYRDIRYILPFLMQLWLFVTPIAYSASTLQEPIRTLYSLNPMVAVVEGFRWALLGNVELSPGNILVSVIAALLLLASGVLFFHHAEGTFSDIV